MLSNQPTQSTQTFKDQKKEKKRLNDAVRQKQKWQHKAQSTPELQISVVCLPDKYLFFDTPAGTASYMIIKYFRILQLKDIVAQPTN